MLASLKDKTRVNERLYQCMQGRILTVTFKDIKIGMSESSQEAQHASGK
jgi:hypothetical protein